MKTNRESKITPTQIRIKICSRYVGHWPLPAYSTLTIFSEEGDFGIINDTETFLRRIEIIKAELSLTGKHNNKIFNEEKQDKVHKRGSFALKLSSVNVTKSAGNW